MPQPYMPTPRSRPRHGACDCRWINRRTSTSRAQRRPGWRPLRGYTKACRCAPPVQLGVPKGFVAKLDPLGCNPICNLHGLPQFRPSPSTVRDRFGLQGLGTPRMRDFTGRMASSPSSIPRDRKCSYPRALYGGRDYDVATALMRAIVGLALDSSERCPISSSSWSPGPERERSLRRRLEASTLRERPSIKSRYKGQPTSTCPRRSLQSMPAKAPTHMSP